MTGCGPMLRGALQILIGQALPLWRLIVSVTVQEEPEQARSTEDTGPNEGGTDELGNV